MAVERASGRTSLIDVLDRVLDKGIVIAVHAARAPGSPGANRVSAPARLRAASAFIPW